MKAVLMPQREGLSDHLLRSLLFVRLANEGDYYPSRQDIDNYATVSEPSGRSSESVMSALTDMTKFGLYRTTEGEPVAAYMLRLGWIRRHSQGLELSPLGASLAAGATGAQSSRRAAEPQGVVLHPEDDAIWTVLTRETARAGAGLLADPYFRAEHLEWVAQATTIRRVLTSTKAFDRNRPMGPFEVELGRLVTDRPDLEVRVSNEAFHDRYLQHADSEVHLIGASLSGIGHSLTTIATAPTVAQDALRKFLIELWVAAEPVLPRQGISRRAVDPEEVA